MGFRCGVPLWGFAVGFRPPTRRGKERQIRETRFGVPLWGFAPTRRGKERQIRETRFGVPLWGFAPPRDEEKRDRLGRRDLGFRYGVL